MAQLFSSHADASLVAIVVVAVFFLVIAVQLFRGKRLSERGEGQTQDRSSASRGNRFLPARRSFRYTQTSLPDLAAVEREITSLIDETYSYRKAGERASADRISQKALSTAIKSLPGDHWLLALALNCRAVYLMEQGCYTEARRHLEPAVAIISEWPGDNQRSKNIAQLKANLKRCQDRLGF